MIVQQDPHATKRMCGTQCNDTAFGWLPTGHYYLSVKRVGEVVFSLVLLILTAPLILFSVLLIKLTSRGPAIYSQTRVGRFGKLYTIYKLRTMVHDCERGTGPQWAKARDPRITWLGAFLRKTHLDELPQLWNVLCGDMSLIGPRPERPEFVCQLENAIPHYRGRLIVRPGVTGLAQVQLPPDTDLKSVRRKLAYDLYYIRHLSFTMDVRLVCCTTFKMVGMPFTALRKLFRMPCHKTVEMTFKRLAKEAEAVPQVQGA